MLSVTSSKAGAKKPKPAPAKTSGKDKKKVSRKPAEKKGKKDKKKKRKSSSDTTDSSSSYSVATKELKSMMLEENHRSFTPKERTLSHLHPQKLGFLLINLIDNLTAHKVFELGGNTYMALEGKLKADPPHLVPPMVRIWEFLLSAFRARSVHSLRKLPYVPFASWRWTPCCT